MVVVSVASGIPLGSRQGQADAFGALTRLFGGVADFVETASTGDSEREGVLGEIVDEPIGTAGQLGGVVQETPVVAGGVGGSPGGVLGGGESIGPDDGDVTPVASGPLPSPGNPPPENPVTEEPAPTATSSVNPVPPASPRPSPSPTPSPSPSPPAAPTPTVPAPTPEPGPIRLDEPVLRFLPEINAAAAAAGVPVSILAGVVRVESNGDPNLIANGTRIGLTGVSESVLASQGFAPNMGNEPAANLLAGAGALAGLYSNTGSWDAALELYFGDACDASGVCAGDYRYAVQAWANYYAGAVSNPGGSGIPLLPPTWSVPAVAPYQGASPRPIPLPPGVAAPTPIPQPTEEPTPTVPPTATLEVSEASAATLTEAPTESPMPTAEPTSTPSPTIAP